MLKELWKFITNIGISSKLSQFDARAIILLNQVSFIMAVWFGIACLLVLTHFELFGFLITLTNVILFSLVLFINSFEKVRLSKNYFMLFGLIMITFINIVFDKSFNPNVHFITTIIFPVLIFKNKRIAFYYVAANVALFIFITYYQSDYEPLILPFESKMGTSFSMTTLIIMLVVFLISLFFRNVNEEFERKLVEKNRYLNDLIEKMKSMQEHMISSEKMASLGQLTAGIAHEINNPINFVSSNIRPLKTDLLELKDLIKMYKKLHLAEDKDTELDKIKEYSKEIDIDFLYNEIETLINGIEEGAGRTKEIVLGLRNFSRIDEGEFKPVDIHKGIDSTLMLLKNKIKNRIEVHKDYDELPLIECIPGKINQVVMNILNNASEAIKDKGEIFVTTKFNSIKNSISISIRDNGLGMKKITLKRIFEPFYTTKEIGKGTGLGLSISYGIIEKHKGKIDVKSEVKKGSEFIITLPVKQNM
ncbi:MAG: hypothetical protein K8S16_19190 [Bacteroidales bacterium]|nr:hypothetical protein [Bacteroidales bacterium]